MKKIFLLTFCILIYMPGAFASTWQEDADAAAENPTKIYEVYRGMPYADFEKTWADVPNWKIKDAKPRLKVFEKDFGGQDALREEFQVMGDNTNVISIEIAFFTNNKKLVDEMFEHIRARLAEKFGHTGQVEGCRVDDPSYPTILTWPGKHIMMTRGSDKKGEETYNVRIRF